MTGGREAKAKIVGFDEDKDVAVLQIQVDADRKVCSCHPTFQQCIFDMRR